ncbi:MAG: helix-turn-helix domain-containing protein [Alphaproteobacteria bacterium]
MEKIKTKGKCTPEDKVIGQNLYIIRRARSISQEAIAKEIGITFQQIQKYEKGTNRISASTLLKLSQLLEVPIGDFYGHLLGEQKESITDLSSESLRLAIQIDKIKDRDIIKNIRNLLNAIS